MSRRQATPEQKAKAAERRAQFKEFCQRVAAMSEDERAELARRMPIVNPAGHALSAYNCCLLLSQFAGTPTIVAGFQQWRKQGRQVCKGQSGLMIWVPTGKRKAADQGGAELAAADQEDKPGFIAGYVWDVSQTEPIEQEAAAE